MAIRFALVVPASSATSVYVLLNDADSQLGWVRAFRDGERVHFGERCEIKDCSNPGVGVAMVRDIGAGGQVEFVWDGTTSFIDPGTGCKRRESAPAGEYTAKFCCAHKAVIKGEGAPRDGVPGHLVAPTCQVDAFRTAGRGKRRFFGPTRLDSPPATGF